jgi:hypothetical protein
LEVAAAEVSVKLAFVFTVTVTFFVTGQPAAVVLVTVYIVVTVGDAVTVEPEVVLRPVAGLQE